MALNLAGEETHFTVHYDKAIGATAPAVAQAVLDICEADLKRLSQYMPFKMNEDGDPFTAPHPKIDVQIVNDPTGPAYGGADNSGFSTNRQSVIRINPFARANTPIADDYAGFLFVAEMAEILMGFYRWDTGSSQGEALSRVMAEELHPASTSNFVNVWLGFPRPRPDWITRNEPADGPFIHGDLDPIAYGCGIIFIYFLRYQLNHSYEQICGAEGSLLSDRYRTLTGASDDPSVRMNKLLDDHFGSGPVQLVGNNPFPLYSGDGRRVFLAFAKPTATSYNLSLAGTVHIRPFFTCPAADYPYRVVGSTVTQVVTATTLGIAFPSFRWHINGRTLTSQHEAAVTVEAKVEIPVVTTPDEPTRDTRTFIFDYQISQQTDTSGTSSTLTITSRSLDGRYRLEIEVDADEMLVPSGAVSTNGGTAVETRSVVYGGTYQADWVRCETAFRKVVAVKLPSVQSLLAFLREGPTPPEPGFVRDALEAAFRIKDDLTRLAITDHRGATEVAHYVAAELGVPVHFFLKGGFG
jgi:hypothetical protein